MDAPTTLGANLTVADVQAAAGRIAGAVVRTPTLHSITLSQITGAEIWLKFENQQFTAAYKERGALAAMEHGALFVDHTTVSPGSARTIAAEADARGVLALDAPVSGGQAGAANGRLSIMCGGTVEAMEVAGPVLEAYASRIVHIGEAGAGQAAKSVNQICIAGTLAGLSEGIRFAQVSGLDLAKVFEAISGGAAQSWQMDNRWKTMTEGEFDFGFAIGWMRKDLAIALGEARAQGLEMPVTELVDRFYATVMAMGGGRQDTSALIRHLPEVGQ
jgi:3-hydroxyisobutyrate dehydrogenase